MRNKDRFLSASFAALWALGVLTPHPARAQCDPKLFSDNATDPNFFWSDVQCGADKGLDDQFGAVVPELVVAGYKYGLNSVVKGLGDVVSTVLGRAIQAREQAEAFGPSNADLMRAVQAGTNRVISVVNRNFKDTDLAQVQAIQQAYLIYQNDPLFYRRVAKADAEWSNNVDWFYAMDLLSLDRHGPLALHASVSLASVFARRMMDLELAYQVMRTTPPSRLPYNPRYDEYLASATPQDLDYWADQATDQALRDVQAIFNGGVVAGVRGGAQVAGLFGHVARLGNGGFRSYSDSRFSTMSLSSSSTDFCGGNIGTVKTMKGTYHFPLDPNNPGANESVPKYEVRISWDPCQHIDDDQKTVPWRLRVTNSDGDEIFSTVYNVPVLDADWHTLDSQFATEEPMRILKRAAYDKFLTMSYGAVRPTLDWWWKIARNAGYSDYTADGELNALVMKSPAVRQAIAGLKAAAPDWSRGASATTDDRLLVNYALTYGAGGLGELTDAAQADRIAWTAGDTHGSDFRQFLQTLADPGEAERYYAGQMAAKLIAIVL